MVKDDFREPVFVRIDDKVITVARVIVFQPNTEHECVRFSLSSREDRILIDPTDIDKIVAALKHDMARAE